MRTSWDNFNNAPKINVGPKALTRAGKMEACFFLELLANSTRPESDLKLAFVRVGEVLKRLFLGN